MTLLCPEAVVSIEPIHLVDAFSVFRNAAFCHVEYLLQVFGHDLFFFRHPVSMCAC
jgi:hypothetical protein